MAKTEHLLMLKDLVRYFEKSGFEVKGVKRPSSTNGIIYATKTKNALKWSKVDFNVLKTV